MSEAQNYVKKYGYKCYRSRIIKNPIELLLNKEFPDEKTKQYVVARITYLYSTIKHKKTLYSIFYKSTTMFIMIASIIITTILSLNRNDNNTFFWITFLLSLCVSIIGSISNFFRWDRKFFLSFSILNKLENEIWTFIENIGNYNDNNNPEESIHKICQKIENINNTLNNNLLNLEEKEDKERKSTYRQFSTNEPNSDNEIIKNQYKLLESENKQLRTTIEHFEKMYEKIKTPQSPFNSDNTIIDKIHDNSSSPSPKPSLKDSLKPLTLTIPMHLDYNNQDDIIATEDIRSNIMMGSFV